MPTLPSSNSIPFTTQTHVCGAVLGPSVEPVTTANVGSVSDVGDVESVGDVGNVVVSHSPWQQYTLIS